MKETYNWFDAKVTQAISHEVLLAKTVSFSCFYPCSSLSACVDVCVCVCVCVRARASVCACVYVYALLCLCVCVRALVFVTRR